MPVPDAVKRVAELAQGKGVRVVGPDGTYRLLSDDEVPTVPDPQTERAAQLMELDAQIRATVGIVASIAQSVNEMTKRVEALLAEVKTALGAVADAQAKATQMAEQLEVAYYTPVIPVYDKAGKLIAAQRIKRGVPHVN